MSKGELTKCDACHPNRLNSEKKCSENWPASQEHIGIPYQCKNNYNVKRLLCIYNNWKLNFRNNLSVPAFDDI